jgi:hypothetical protein
MDEFEITLGERVYRMRPMPARLFLAILRDDAPAQEMLEALDAACISHPHGDGALLDAVSIGAAEAIGRAWIRRSREDPYPPADGQR